MSPTKFHEDEQPKRVINGPRPSLLRINKDSNVIQKSSSCICPSSSISALAQPNPATDHHQQRKPVIIYTHSPKIIHAKARDFMALVQKLTGLSRSDDETKQKENQKKGQIQFLGEKNCVEPLGHDDNESSSVLTDEKYGGGISDVREASSSSVSPLFRTPNPYFADIPLFTPNSSDFFCSPRPLFRYSDLVSPSPNMGNLMSPSFLEFMKGLPEY